MAADITFQRIADGIRWRLAEAEAHLPPQARKQIDIRRVKDRVRRGEFALDAELLIAAYSRAWDLLLEKEQPDELGSFLEFGVFYGSSLACMTVATAQKQLDHVRIVGFDSFEGLPATATTEDGGLWYPGQFCSSLETTLEFLRRSGVADGRVDLVKGWFSDTATPATAKRLGVTKASVIMIDCDLYSSTVDALAFCEPLIDRQAVIFFDDWNAGNLAEKNLGERRAFDELLARHPELHAEELSGMDYKPKSDPKAFMVTRSKP